MKNLRTDIPVTEPTQERLDAIPGDAEARATPQEQFEARLATFTGHGPNGEPVVYNGVPVTPHGGENEYAAAARSVVQAHQSASPENPYLAAAQSVVKDGGLGPTPEQNAADEQRKADMLRWRVANETRAPEEQAEILRLSAALGWAPDVVAADLPKARSTVDAKGLDAEKVLRAHPALADFIGDPRTTALARSDTERLTGLAYLTGVASMTSDRPAVPGAVGLWLREGSLAREVKDQQLALMFPTTAEPGPLEADPTGLGAAPQGLRDLTEAEKARLRDEVSKKSEALRRLEAYGDGVESMGFGQRLLAKTARFVLTQGPTLAEGAAASVAGGIAAGPAGAAAAGTAFWAADIAPGISWQLSELKDPHTGAPVLSEEEARNYAIAASIPIGLIQAVGLEGFAPVAGTVAKGLGVEAAANWAVSKPVVEKALSFLTKTSVEKLLEKRGLGGVLSRAAMRWGSHEVQGGLMMAMQGGLTQAALEVAAGTHGVDAPGTVGEAFGDGFVKGVEDFALLSAWAPARAALKEHGQIRASHESASVLRDIAENTLNSKTAQASPEEFGKLMNAFAGDKSVYVNREAFDEYAQEKKVDPRELAAGINGDNGESYDSAKASGQLVVPMGRWAEKVVLPGHAEKLSPDTKLNLNELTPRQIKEKAKLIVTQVEDRAKERGPAFEQEVKDLRDTIASAAKEAGYSRDQGNAFAETLSRHAATTSLRFDVPLRDALVHAGLPQLRLEGLPVLGKLMEGLKFTPEERAAAEGQLQQAAWHGSPHSFERFDMTKLDSGVGQSLWAWGLNFAKEKKTADFYRTMLSDDERGHLYRVEVPEDQALLDYNKKVSEQAPAVRAVAEKALKLAGKDGQDLSGREVYETLQGELPGGARDASEWFKKEGVPGLRYTVGDGQENNFVIWDEKHIQSFEKVELAQEPKVQLKMPKNAAERTPRGTIRFMVDGAGRAFDFDIRALRGDVTTLAHETGHFLSWSLHELAARHDAPEGVKADYAAMLKFGGWDGAEARLADNAERSRLSKLLDVTESREPKTVEAMNTRNEIVRQYREKLVKLNAKEEKLSHAWEQYLAEGRAPVAGLRGVFARFRRWMGEVYGGLGGIAKQYKGIYGEDLSLSDEVRGVFSRFFAVDNEVERMRGDDAGFDWGSVLHLTPEEAGREAQLREQKIQAARDGLDRVTAGYASESAKGFLRAERERIRADVSDEMGREQIYSAWDFLKTGEYRDPETGRAFAPGQLADAFKGEDGKPLRLSYAEAVREAGKETADILRKRGLVTEKKGGVAAEEVFQLFHFNSGKEMLESLAGAPEKDAVVEHLTARRFEEAFGLKLHELADALSAEGQNALHNPADILHALWIRDAIARQLGGGKGRKLAREILNKNAEDIVSAQRVRDVSPKYYLDAERRYAKDARDLLAKAFKAKEAERNEEADALFSDAYHKWDSVVLSKLLWGHARDARREMDASEARLEKYAKTSQKARLGFADQTLALSDANDSILGAIGMKKSDEKGRPLAVAGKPEHIDAVLALMQGAGAEDVALDADGRLKSALWDADALRELLRNPKPWKELRLEEARNVRDAVENIARVGRLSNSLNILGKTLFFDNFIQRVDESSRYLGDQNAPVDPKAQSRLAKILRPGLEVLQNLDANLSEIRIHIERLTGGEHEHPLYKFFVTEREGVRHLENLLMERFGKRVNDLWHEMPKSMRKRMNKEIEELRDELPMPDTKGVLDPNSPRSRSWLVMVAMNMGNEGNKQRLLDGYRWTEGQVLAALQKHLSAHELKFVQDVWDSLGELYPYVEKTHIADKGIRPEKVEASPFKLQLADGQVVEMRGGYFPIRYDPRVPMQGHFGEKQANLISTEVPIYSRPKTVQQHTMARSNSAEGLLHLNFDVVPSHVTQVIHDATHRLWVKQASRIVHDASFESLAKARLGEQYEKQFRTWVKDVAGQYDSSASGALGKTERFFSFAKSATTLSAVGFNLAVPLADITNPLLPIIGGDINPLYMMRVTRQLLTRPLELRAFALENSIELNARKKHGNSLGLDPSLTSGKGALGTVQHWAYAPMEFSDRVTVTPIWLAKYMQELAATNDHDVAVREAEATVQKYFPSSDMASRAALLRNKGFLGQLTFLWGFGSKVYGLNRRVITDMVDSWRDPEESVGDKGIATARAVGVALGYAVTIGLLGDFVSGKGPKRTQKDGDWLKEKALSYASYNVPMLQYFSDRSAIPASGLWAKLKNETKGVGDQKHGHWESIAALGSALAIVDGAPGVGLNQALKTGKYLDNRASGDLRRGQYGRLLSGLIYGDTDRITPFNIGQR